jgi:hypothetical protein
MRQWAEIFGGSGPTPRLDGSLCAASPRRESRISIFRQPNDRHSFKRIWSVPQRRSGGQPSLTEVDRLLAEGEKLRRRSAELANEAADIERRLAGLYDTGGISDRRKAERRKKAPRLRGK